jgi:hypothetical protein
MPFSAAPIASGLLIGAVAIGPPFVPTQASRLPSRRQDETLSDLTEGFGRDVSCVGQQPVFDCVHLEG